MFGPCISLGLSMWRLIKRDYVDPLNTDLDGNRNLRQALNVLYSLALLQGGIFMYRFIFSTKRNAIATDVATRYRLLDDEAARLAAEDYFSETWSPEDGPFHPSIAKRRNLVTYAVELLESRQPSKYASGVSLMGTLLQHFSRDDTIVAPDESPATRGELNKALTKDQLLGSSFTGTIVRKLLWSRDPARPAYGGRRQKVHATRILEVLAGEIRLGQFPRALRRIESLLEDENIELMWRGLNILAALAADEDNRKAMRSMRRSLLPKMVDTVKMVLGEHERVVAPMSNAADEASRDKIHRMWAKKLARPALGILILFPIDSTQEPPRDNDLQVRQQIRTLVMAINATATMQNIVDCDWCDTDFKEAARKILEGESGDEAEAIRNFLASNMII